MAETAEPTAPVPAETPAPPQPKEKKPAPKQDAPAPAGEKKLSGAELKKKAKEEKAARRAQAKSTTGGPSGPPQQQQQDAKGGKGKPKKQDGQQGQQQQQNLPVRSAAGELKPKEPKALLPEALSHLSLAKRPGITETDKDVKQGILLLGQHMAAFHPKARDSTERLVLTLRALKKVINSYTTPQGTTFSRDFTSHMLSPQIEYLAACRPMCFGMGNAIRWLKLQISTVDIDLSDTEVKKELCTEIDTFISTRVTVARPEIAKKTAAELKNNDTVLTFGDHYLVRESLIYAHNSGKTLKIIVCEDPWQPHALAFVDSLKKAGIQTSQIELSYTYGQHCLKLDEHIRKGERVTVLAGAEAMFTDGSLYARQGTLDIARKATLKGIKFMALCETINVTDRLVTDSLTLNEVDPNTASEDMVRLLFDVTPSRYISSVVTETGMCPAEAINQVSGDLGEY